MSKESTELLKKAQRMTRDANSERKWRNAAKVWEKVDRGYGYFQDKIDYCNKMASMYQEADSIFKAERQ